MPILRAAPILLLVLSLFVVPITPVASFPEPADPPMLPCPALPSMPCLSGQTTWTSVTPGAGWGEVPARSLMAADGMTLYTAATLQGQDDGGSGCLLYAIDVESGLKRWSTVLPRATGCGLVVDIVLEPTSGDLLLAAVDWGGSTGIHRLDAATGLVRWQTQLDDAVYTALHAAEGTVYAGGWREATIDRPQPFRQSLDAATGAVLSEGPIGLAAHDDLFLLDMHVDLQRGHVVYSGAAVADDTNRAVVLATSLTGDTLWVAEDPSPGASFGARLAYAQDSGNTFLAGQNGILTVDPEGAVVALAPLVDGETWDDLTLLYDVVYDPVSDTAVMSGSRSGDAPAYVALAADGTTGAVQWTATVAQTEHYAIAAKPTVTTDGTVWITGTVVQGAGAAFTAVVAAHDVATGQQEHRTDVHGAATHAIAALDDGSVVIAGMTMPPVREASMAFEARFDARAL